MIKIKNTRSQIIGIPVKTNVFYLKTGEEIVVSDKDVDINLLKRLYLKYEYIKDSIENNQQEIDIMPDSVVKKAEEKIEVLKKRHRKKKNE